MEKRTTKTVGSSIKTVNLSLSPKIACRSRSNNHAQLSIRKKVKAKSQIEEKQKEPTYSIAYIGENSGELQISFKRFSLPKLSPKEISKSHHKNIPKFNIQSNCEYTINKYFRPKALTPSTLKLSDLDKRTKKKGLFGNNDKFVGKNINTYSLLDFRYK